MSTDDILTERLYNLEKQLEREKTMTDVKQPEETPEDEVVAEDTTEELDAEDEDGEDSNDDVKEEIPDSEKKAPYRY